MWALLIASLKAASKQVAVHGGLVVLIAGIFGGILNIIVFLSIRTFRQRSCAFYLTIMSAVNIGQLLAALLPRILLYVYGSDGTDTSLFYCKFRLYFSHVCVMISLTCFCLATIDQYCGTSLQPRLQQLCRIRVALRLVFIFSLLWILHGIPYAVFSYHSMSSASGKVSCTMTDVVFIQYRAYFIVLALLGFLPFSITAFFGLLAYWNVRRLLRRSMPLFRRKLDKQLTVMVLMQVFVNFFTLLPYTIVNIISLNVENERDLLLKAKVQLASHVTLILYYVYYANSFYVYICTSDRFRRQLVYVLLRIQQNLWQRRPRMAINQIRPQ